MFEEGDIILVYHVRENGYDMNVQASVPLAEFPVPALVLQTSDYGSFWVHWIHPVTKTNHEWHFKVHHTEHMEKLE